MKDILDLSRDDRRELYLRTVSCSVGIKKHRYFNHIFNLLKESVIENEGWTSHKDRWDEEIWFLINCMHKMVSRRAVSVCIGKSYKTFPHNTKATYHKTWRLIETLSDMGLVEVFKGGIGYEGFYEKRYLSVVYIDKSLLAMVADVVDSRREYSQNSEGIMIRDRESKEEKRLVRNEYYKNSVKVVSDFNKALRETSIEFDGERIATQQYRRIFVDDYTKGGRWYNEVGGVQVLPRGMRGRLTMEGEELVEVDFKAMHPSLLYQKKYNKTPDVVNKFFEDYRKDKGQPFDMYLHGEDISFIDAKEEDRRELIKYSTLICLNTRSKASSIKPISKFIEDEGVYGDVDIGKLIGKIVAHHPLLKDEFFKDKGVYLQKDDSDIMSSIIGECLEEGIVVLPLHDGVLCKASNCDKVESVFKESWKREFGDTTFCKVEVGR